MDRLSRYKLLVLLLCLSCRTPRSHDDWRSSSASPAAADASKEPTNESPLVVTSLVKETRPNVAGKFAGKVSWSFTAVVTNGTAEPVRCRLAIDAKVGGCLVGAPLPGPERLIAPGATAEVWAANDTGACNTVDAPWGEGSGARVLATCAGAPLAPVGQPLEP